MTGWVKKQVILDKNGLLGLHLQKIIIPRDRVDQDHTQHFLQEEHIIKQTR